MHSPKSLCIIIATKNRAAKLQQTLEAILSLQAPTPADFEVLVADNGSSDATSDVCAKMQDFFGGRLRRIFVPSGGKSVAANSALQATRSEIIGFLDDDVVPQSDWLVVIQKEFSDDPDLGAISGRVELKNPNDLPISIRSETKRVEVKSLDAANIFIGCNLVVRRTWIERVGRFDPDLGPGTRFVAAEDLDFSYRLWKGGGKLVYVPSLFVLHDHGRQTYAEEMQARRGYVIGRGAFLAKHVFARDWRALRTIYRELDWSMRAALRKAGKLGWRHPYWLLAGFMHYCLMRAGRVIGLFRVGIECALL